MLSDGYVKYEEAEVPRSHKISEIMRKVLFYFMTAKFVMGYPCVRHYILFYIHGPAVLHFFALSKYHISIKIQNSH